MIRDDRKTVRVRPDVYNGVLDVGLGNGLFSSFSQLHDRIAIGSLIVSQHNGNVIDNQQQVVAPPPQGFQVYYIDMISSKDNIAISSTGKVCGKLT